MAAWHTIPVFISSTFLDMQAERDVLVKRVFPSLRAKLDPYRVRVVEIDLRWGITSEQERSGRVLDLCFQMIDQSRPYFVGLLGERYGSVPRQVAADVFQRHSWLPGATPTRTSVTELEVLYGVLNHPLQSSRALFYLRDSGPLDDVAPAIRGFLTDAADADARPGSAESDHLGSIASRLDRLGVADSKRMLDQWLDGEWPPLKISELLSPRERLDLLKMRLRRRDLVRMDGYRWKFEGIRVRWNLVRFALPDEGLVRRLESVAPQGIVTPEAFMQLRSEPQIVQFLRDYGAVSLSGLDDLAAHVESDLLRQLERDERVQDAIRQRRRRTVQGRSRPTSQQSRRILTWATNVAGPRLDHFKSLPADVANQIVERELARSQNPQIKSAIELWYDRRDAGGAEVGGLAEDWADERDQHARYAETRLSLYTRRHKVEREIKDYLVGSTGRFLVVTGASGTGKSAIMAKASRFCRALSRHGRASMASHFVGATASSATLPALIRRLCVELQLLQDEDLDQLAVDVDTLATSFARALQQLEPEKPCYLVIDALDQLDPGHEAHSLHWLPISLPSHVHVILSFASDVEDGRDERLAGALRLRGARWLDLDQQEYRLTDAHRGEIIERVPSLVAKSLEPPHVAALLDNDATRNPLYLKVALEQLRAFGTFRLLLARINEFNKALTPEQLFTQVIEGLSLDFDARIVRRVLTALAASRHGMSESELVELAVDEARELGGPQQQGRRDETAAILRHLQPYLHWRGSLLDFLHRSLRSAVEKTFVRERSSLREVHQTLGGYFERVGRNANPPWSDQGKRGIAESLHHFLEAQDWDSVLRLLNDDIYVFHKGRSPYYGDLVHEWSRALVRAPACYATALAIAFARCAGQQLALTEVVGGVVLETARLDEQRFAILRNSLNQKGELWRGELLKAQALLIGIGLNDAAQTVIRMVEMSYDGDEPPDDGLAASYQQLAVLRNAAGNHEEGLRFAEKSAELGRAANDEVRVAIADSTKVASLEGLGRHAEAAQLTRQLFERGRGRLGVGRILPRAILSGFDALVQIGEVEDAESLLHEGLQECGQHRATQYDYASLATLLGNHCLQRQKPEEAISTLRTALGMPARAYPEELRPNIYYLLFLCHAQLGQQEEARSVLRAAVDYPWSPKGRQVFEQAFQSVLSPAAAFPTSRN